MKQAKDYDPNAAYIRLWCPEIAHLPTGVLLDPRLLTEDIRTRCAVTRDVLPDPIVPLTFGGTPVSLSDGTSGARKQGGGRTRRAGKSNHGAVPGRRPP